MTIEGGDRAQCHRGGGGDLFICFTSRAGPPAPMRIPSTKSLPSPGRKDGKFRDPVVTAGAMPALSASLSARRLRTSGSVKGGQSPGIFPSVNGSRKKGCGFEAAEPTSPKVTCIGQVRVRTGRKKAAAALRSRRIAGGGEVSFRGAEQGIGSERECFPSRSHQRWVHLQLGGICDAVKAFGSEINCFLPCCGTGRSSCSPGADKGRVGGGDEERKRASNAGMGSCGAAFAGWLMAVHESGGEGKRDEVVGMEIVVEEVVERRGSRRELRELELLADELEKNGGFQREKEIGEEEEEEVPVCVPPPNALLLMRCRSDPVRMSALENRFWGSPVARVEVEDEEVAEEESADHGGEEGDQENREEEEEEAKDRTFPSPAAEIKAIDENSLNGVPLTEVVVKEVDFATEAEDIQEEMDRKESLQPVEDVKYQNFGDVFTDEAREVVGSCLKETEEKPSMETEEEEKQVVSEFHCHDSEAEKENKEFQLPAITDKPQARKCGERKKSKRSVVPISTEKQRRWSFSKEKEAGRRHSSCTEEEAIRRSASFMEREGRRRFSFSSEGEARRSSFYVDSDMRKRRSLEVPRLVEAEAKRSWSGGEGRLDMSIGSVITREAAAGRGEGAVVAQRRGEDGVEEKRSELPDCLLLMLYEPKLSMEVSKETWVCTADFIRWKPHHRRAHQQRQPHQPANWSDDVGDIEGGGNAEPELAETVEAKEGGVWEDKKREPASKATDVASPSPPPPHPPPPQPPQASPELAKAAERKLGSTYSEAAATYGPFVLTRCKSEPMRSSARLLPEACFWKNRHQPIGAAGLGF